MSDVAIELLAVQGQLAQGPGALLKIMNRLLAKAIAGQDQAGAFVNRDFSGVSLVELAEGATVVAHSHLGSSRTMRQLWDIILAEYHQGRCDEHQASLYL